MEDPKRILLVSGHSLFAEGLRSLLSAELDLDIIGVAAATDEAVRIIGQSQVDVVIVDRNDRNIRGRDFLSLLNDYHNLRVITVTLADNQVHLYRREQAAQAGIDGLIEAIERA